MQGDPDPVNLRVPFQAPSASLVRHELREWLEEQGFPGRDRRRRPRRRLRARRQQRAARRAAAGQRHHRLLVPRQRRPRDLGQRRRQRVDDPAPGGRAAVGDLRPRAQHRRGARRPLVGRGRPRPHDRARAHPALTGTGPQPRPAHAARVGSLAPWESARESRPAPASPQQAERAATGRTVPSGRGSRARAGRAAATRPATAAPSGPAPRIVARPFAGLRSECDLVALRELVPAASAPLPLADAVEHRPRGRCSARCCRWRRRRWCARTAPSGWGCRSSTASATRAASWPRCSSRRWRPSPARWSGSPRTRARARGCRTCSPTSRSTVTVHEGFDFWVADVDDPTGSVHASLEQANAAAAPTARLTSVEAAYWTDVGTKEHLRWVMPHDEDALLDALARLHAAGEDHLVEGGRLVGMFRAHGLLVPVWDLPVGHRRRGARGAGRRARAGAGRRRWPGPASRSPTRSARPAPGSPTGRSRSAEQAPAAEGVHPTAAPPRGHGEVVSRVTPRHIVGAARSLLYPPSATVGLLHFSGRPADALADILGDGRPEGNPSPSGTSRPTRADRCGWVFG